MHTNQNEQSNLDDKTLLHEEREENIRLQKCLFNLRYRDFQ